ncbi:MAG: tRNA lysidine(34) synthetase TilS [Pseudomonadota bacterium]
MSADGGLDGGSAVDEAFAEALSRFALTPHAPVLLACSGGGDSTAMLHLSAAQLGPERLHVVSINHNLRAQAADEIAALARQCEGLGVTHRSVDWTWSGRGNLQAQARQARRNILLAEAARLGAGAVFLGHTQDDQAETVLMRLARGSGTDGLAGMAEAEPPIFRPLLGARRADLRAWLTARGLTWSEDPSNSDLRFDRVKARAIADTLEALGLGQDRLVRMADVMAEDAALLAYTTERWCARHARREGGDLILDGVAYGAAPTALRARVLSAALSWFSGVPYKPRRRAMQHWQERIAAGKAAPLGGVLAERSETGAIRLWREPQKISVAATLEAGQSELIWDHRWHIALSQPFAETLTIAPLGEVLDALPGWRETGLSRRSLSALPAILSGDRLLAAPIAGFEPGAATGITINVLPFPPPATHRLSR